MSKTEKKYYDPNINRKSQIYDHSFKTIKNNIPLPAIIEITNSGVCNRKCSFCPRSDPNYPDINEFISPDIHDKICKELSNYDFDGIFAYCGFNEPLLKKDIYRDIKIARQYLPKAKIEIVTNGDVLNNERIKKLFESGLTTLLISVYDGDEAAEKFQKMCDDNKLDKSQYVIRNRYMGEEKDFGMTLSNRSGTLKNATYSVQPLSRTLKKVCTYPSYMFFVDYNGDVLMCSHDWGKKMILGNLKKDSVIDIWTSTSSMLARKKLNNADRNFSPCDKCDVVGNLVGKKHADAWRKIQN